MLSGLAVDLVLAGAFIVTRAERVHTSIVHCWSEAKSTTHMLTFAAALPFHAMQRVADEVLRQKQLQFKRSMAEDQLCSC